MRIFKRSDSKVYYLDYTDAQGNRVKESTGTTSKKLAEDILAKRKNDVIQQKKLGIKPVIPVLFSDFVNQYLEYSAANKRAKSTKLDKMALRNLSSYLTGKGRQYIDEITEEDIEGYKAERSKTVSKSTVTRELASIKHFFTIAGKWKKIGKSPAAEVKKPGQPPGRVRYLSIEEIRRLLDACKLPYLKLFVVISLNTGMRKNEVLQLKAEDIDFENGLIHLEDSKNKERADILMNSLVFKALKEYPDYPSESSSRIFNVDDVKKSFAGALKRAGIKNFKIHDVRHTFASHLAMSGTPLTTLKELMRHKTIQMTLRYAHLSPSHKRQEIEKLSQIWPTVKNEDKESPMQ